MDSPNHIIIFPHEQKDLLKAVHDLSVRARNSHLLHILLKEASQAIHREAIALTSAERANIGDFSDLVELAERHLNQPTTVIEAILVTTVQIGQLVV
jgi:orsellinic acid synthase